MVSKNNLTDKKTNSTKYIIELNKNIYNNKYKTLSEK